LGALQFFKNLLYHGDLDINQSHLKTINSNSYFWIIYGLINQDFKLLMKKPLNVMI